MDDNVPIWWYCCLVWRFGLWMADNGCKPETLYCYFIGQVLPPDPIVVVVGPRGEVIQ